MLTKLKDAARRVNERARAARAMRAMQEMDERMLRDIGVTRADIDRAVRNVRWMV
jgi:uncharacterized protein YjiS (DUF1127 family)